MDRELKASPWDFTKDHDPCFAMLIGSNSLGPNNNGEDFKVDLKLGRLDDVGNVSLKLQKSPLKRARSISVTQNMTCLVDGCIADLSRCREYHRRHRVCETHSKTPVVSVGCKDQRFCQQCSRFHALTEFDDEKRSCRKRLDGHNRRRRKPQPEAFYLNHGNFLSSHQGTRILQFGGSEPYPTWPTVPKPTTPQHSATCPISSSTLQREADKRFPFLIINEHERNNNTSPSNVNLNRAHSLLSLPTSYVHQQMGPTASQFGFPAHQHSRSSTIFPQASSYQNSYSGNEITMMSLSPDDLLEKEASHVLPFSWK